MLSTIMVAGNANGRTIYVGIIADVMRLVASDADADADVEPADGEAAIDPAGADVKVIRPRSRFILATSAAQTGRQATNKIALGVGAGDTIRFYAKSGSNNFEDAALIEDISPIDDSGILQDFTLVDMERNTAAPRDYDTVFPARFPERDFWFRQCVVTAGGEQHCSVLLAVYDRDEQGQPRLAGHYRWALQLTVKLTSPSPAPQNRGETS